MDNDLSGRQKREREYYNLYSQQQASKPLTFDPVLGKEKRPWNSYWMIYQLACQAYYNRNQKLLDFGCGSGVASLRYAKIGYDVYGFDISENNIRLCQKQAADYNFTERTHFGVQKAENLDYEDEVFDVVAGIDILHHVDIEPAVKQVFRILKPGGRAFFREWIEVPAFEALRNLSITKRFFPKEVSLEEHRTMDERKLNKTDLKIIGDVFAQQQSLRFCIFSRLRSILPIKNFGKPSRLEMFDYVLTKVFPFAGRLGGEIVLMLQKDGVGNQKYD